MSVVDRIAPSQGASIPFELDLLMRRRKVWHALRDRGLPADWLLPSSISTLEPGATLTFEAPPEPGCDGTVSCRFVELEAQRKLSYT